MDRFGIRRVVAVALTVIAAGSVLTVWMAAPWQLVLYWGILVGLGSGSMALAFAATVTNRWFVARRGLVTGILTAAGASGQLVFLPLLSWLVETASRHGACWPSTTRCAAVVAFAGGLARDVFGSYDVVWYASGALCAAAALMALVIRRRPTGVKTATGS